MSRRLHICNLRRVVWWLFSKTYQTYRLSPHRLLGLTRRRVCSVFGALIRLNKLKLVAVSLTGKVMVLLHRPRSAECQTSTSRFLHDPLAYTFVYFLFCILESVHF